MEYALFDLQVLVSIAPLPQPLRNFSAMNLLMFTSRFLHTIIFSVLIYLSIGYLTKTLEKTVPTSVHSYAKRSLSSPISLPVFKADTWLLGGVHCVNMSLGTPRQTLTFVLDFTNGHTLVDAANRTAYVGGTYDMQSSASFEQVTECETISTTKDSLGACDFKKNNSTDGTLLSYQASDDLQVGTALIADAPFQLVLASNDFDGGANANSLGLGYSVHQFVSTAYYPSLVETLVDAGIIGSRVFSIALPVDEIEIGELTFGGFDAGWFISPQTPVTLDFIPTNYTKDEGTMVQTVNLPIVPIQKITITSQQHNQTFTTFPSQGIKQIAALIDYSQGWWVLPPELHDIFMSHYNSSSGLVPCKNNMTDLSINIDFGNGLNTTTSGNDLLNQLGDDQLTDNNRNQECMLAIAQGNMSDEAPYFMMGTTVFKDLYSIFDLDNGQVTMGRVDHKDHESIPIVVGKGPNAVQEALTQKFNSTRSQTRSGTTTARIAGPAFTSKTSFRAVSEAPISYNTYGDDQEYLPLDARTSTLKSSRSSSSSSSRPSSSTPSPSSSISSESFSGTLGLDTATSNEFAYFTAVATGSSSQVQSSGCSYLVAPATAIFCTFLLLGVLLGYC